jgi:acetoin utilization protein AcuB
VYIIDITCFLSTRLGNFKEIGGKMLVKNWMKRNPVTVEPEVGVKAAFHLLKKHHIRQLPVLKDGLLIGIVTDRDFRRPETNSGIAYRDEAYRLEDRFKVGDIMQTEVLNVTEDTPIEEAAGLLLKHKINSLPVISRNGKLTGIITTSDILRAFIWLYKYEKS